jgi:ribosome-associated toxin RatA of RatAB toxin-antitoxin module
MTRLEHSILINRPLTDVFALARQVETYPDFLPGYIESRIVERRGETLLLQRAAIVRGKHYRWQSFVQFEENRAITFEQAEGPLRGMKVVWAFEAEDAEKTRVTITHEFQLTQPLGLGRLLERFYFAPRISEIASQVVKALKRTCEVRDQKEAAAV